MVSKQLYIIAWGHGTSRRTQRLYYHPFLHTLGHHCHLVSAQVFSSFLLSYLATSTMAKIEHRLLSRRQLRNRAVRREACGGWRYDRTSYHRKFFGGLSSTGHHNCRSQFNPLLGVSSVVELLLLSVPRLPRYCGNSRCVTEIRIRSNWTIECWLSHQWEGSVYRHAGNGCAQRSSS